MSYHGGMLTNEEQSIALDERVSRFSGKLTETQLGIIREAATAFPTFSIFDGEGNSSDEPEGVRLEWLSGRRHTVFEVSGADDDSTEIYVFGFDFSLPESIDTVELQTGDGAKAVSFLSDIFRYGVAEMHTRPY